MATAGSPTIADNPLLLQVMQSIPVQDVAFERLLTSLRRSLLSAAHAPEAVSETVLGFACALAQQCFINEYIFATSPEEDAQVDHLRRALHDTLVSAAALDPLQIAVLAMYEPLHALAIAPALLDRSWMDSSTIC